MLLFGELYSYRVPSLTWCATCCQIMCCHLCLTISRGKSDRSKGLENTVAQKAQSVFIACGNSARNTTMPIIGQRKSQLEVTSFLARSHSRLRLVYEVLRLFLSQKAQRMAGTEESCDLLSSNNTRFWLPIAREKGSLEVARRLTHSSGRL